LLENTKDAIDHSMDPNPTIRVVVTGFAAAVEHYTYKVSPDDPDDFTGTGYGFLGRYPIQITILRVEDFMITRPHASPLRRARFPL